MHVKFSKYAKHEDIKNPKQSDIINACLQSYNLVIVLMSRVYKK
jgi:hypothetical protein